jgi:hypothetical protein
VNNDTRYFERNKKTIKSLKVNPIYFAIVHLENVSTKELKYRQLIWAGPPRAYAGESLKLKIAETGYLRVGFDQLNSPFKP